MKDTMQVLAKAIYDVINNNIVIDGSTIPVYDKKRRAQATGGLYIILGQQSENDDPQTSDAFITTSSIDIEIWHVTEYEVSSDVINEVSNQILQRISTVPEGDNLPGQNLFQIQDVRRTSSTLTEFSIGPSDTALNKIITIQATITQQFP